MKQHFGIPEAKDKPGYRHMLHIEERTYSNMLNLRRAKALIKRHHRNLKVDYSTVWSHGTVNGRPKLYICRSWTPQEMEDAGVTETRCPDEECGHTMVYFNNEPPPTNPVCDRCGRPYFEADRR